MTNDKNDFYDLIYAGAEVEKIITDKYTKAKITDASDDIHQERFEVTIENVTDDEFYPFAIKKHFGGDCFALQMMIHSTNEDREENHAKLNKWIKEAKNENTNA